LDNITDVLIEKKEFELTKPYKLSFETIKVFVSIQVTVQLDTGKEKCAEVVPLFGYSEETEDQIWASVHNYADQIIGKELGVARDYLTQFIRKTPFSVSPFLTAIDLFEYNFNIEESEMPSTIIPLDTNGFVKDPFYQGNTFKVKLSGNLSQDLNYFNDMINSGLKLPVVLRLDANQGFSLENAIKFYSYLEKNKNSLPVIEYVEQPLQVSNWSGVARLINEFKGLDTMLDEAIITKEDLIKAIDLKIPFVKLKLFKQGGIKELIELSKLAHKKGVKLILGNGVATWMSNQVELSIYSEYRELYYKEHEANGFLKVKK